MSLPGSGVVVVGAGVIGLSTALHLLERFPGELDVTVVSDKFSPDTTSDKAGVMVFPVDFRAKNVKNKAYLNKEEDIKRWTRGTFQKFHSIYRSEENAKVELCLRQGYYFLDDVLPDPWYVDEVFGFRHVELGSVETSVMHIPPSCVAIWSFSTYTVDPTSYLRWLTEKVRENGGKFEQRKVSSLDELASYDVIINCTGLGSCELVEDELMYPLRGQAVLVEAPWVNQWILHYQKDSFCGVLPRARNVLLGGTHEVRNGSETIDPETSANILSCCQKYVPSLCGAKVIGEWASLRPLRDPIRLEAVEGPGGSLLVHCYGHGGQGFSMSWGSALDIGDIVQHRLQPAKC